MRFGTAAVAFARKIGILRHRDNLASEKGNKQYMATTSDSLAQRIETIHEGVDGWCTTHKATILYNLAREEGIELGLEIGIFAGKSFFPVCLAFKEKAKGKHYGVEPWSNAIAVETATNAINDEWWSKLDMLQIKKQFFRNLAKFDFTEFAAIIETPSDSAYALFSTFRYYKKIDILHIDGSHSTPEALHDVTNWTKLVRPGGYVILDDINWPSVGLAYEYLKTLGSETHRSFSEGDGFFSVVKLR